MDFTAPRLRDVYLARSRLAGIAHRTPLRRAGDLSRRHGADIRLKLESMQETGAFKLRGAVNALSQLSPEALARGVVAVSTGNHGRAVALAARRLGARATICLSRLVPDNKLAAIRALGAEARIAGDSQDEAEIEADRLVAAEGASLIPPFDDPAVIAGQGTIGLELLEDWPELDTLICPISGGGLIGGIALVLKAADPAIRVVGVCMARGPAMVESMRAGRPVPVVEEDSLADSLGGGIGRDNRHTLALCRALVDETVLLEEEQIAAGMRFLYRSEGLVTEGGGAVGVAALLAGLARPGPRTAVIVSGGNVGFDRFRRVLDGGSTA